VSRTPVREALHRLNAEGLVSIRPRLGATVKSMDSKEFRETCELRVALEGHAASLAAANHTPADLREIKDALDNMRRLTLQILEANDEKPYLDELRREDVRFHIGIMTAAKNELMKREILRLHLVNRVVGGPKSHDALFSRQEDINDNRRKALASHEAIYEAIARKDVPAAKHAMEEHIEDVIDKALRAFNAANGKGASRQLTDEELIYTG
jgi:DNA-binding GntR family transcriptional regulator